jgi:cell shape-determining protein MreC
VALSTRRSGRTRFTVLLLVLTAVTLLTLDGRGFGPIDSARSGVLSALSPVGDFGAAVFRPIGNAWDSAFQQGDLKTENDQLREENDRLNGEVTAGQVAQEQLQQLLENSGFNVVGTSAIGVAQGNLSPTVLQGGKIDVTQTDVAADGIVVTGGTQLSSFPPDLPIGTITSVQANAAGRETKVEITLFARTTDLTYADVLIWPAP